eukprot:30951-Pelagococcus_subviridis.AAC.7
MAGNQIMDGERQSGQDVRSSNGARAIDRTNDRSIRRSTFQLGARSRARPARDDERHLTRRFLLSTPVLRSHGGPGGREHREDVARPRRAR